MDGTKAFFKNVVGLSSPVKQSSATKEAKSRYGNGIGNTTIGIPMDLGGGSGYMGVWGEDRMTNIAICIRMFQLVCAFSMLIVCIVLATFQNQWIGKLSGLTALLLIVTVLTFLGIGFMLAVSFLPHSLHITQDKIIRVLEQPRLGLVMNGLGAGVWLILAMTQTISSYTMPGCKDVAKDPHADSSKGKKEDFANALPSFCTTKKAGAAFAWFLFITALTTLALFLRMWKLSRKNGPRIPPFVHPADDGAFEPIGEDMEHDEEDNIYAQEQAGMPISTGRYGDGGDGRYGYGGYDDPNLPQQYNQQGYEGYNQNAHYASGRNDPFADQNPPRQSYDYGAYAANTPSTQDPYAIIQQQLRADRPPQLPPLYRG